MMNNLNENQLNQQAQNAYRQNTYSNSFYVEIDASGERIYHWIDTRVDMLSSSKLWSILKLCEGPAANMDTAFADAITNELINRNDFAWFESESNPILRIQ